MKTFKIKDLVISMEGAPRGTLHKTAADMVCRCTIVKSIINPCTIFGSDLNVCRVSLIITTNVTTNCGGTIICTGSPLPTTLMGELTEVEVLTELKEARARITEYEKAIEANLKPETAEELEMLESKLSAALKEVNTLQRQMKQSS